MDTQYADRNARELDEAGGYYIRHVYAMTREDLHEKSKIAAELAYRDMEIDRLKGELEAIGAGGVESLRAAPVQAATDEREAFADTRDAIRDLIAIHSAELEQNEYAYFELAHTRQTGWCAWITDHPRSMPPMPTVNPDRKVIASGQGDTPEEACSAAIAAAKGSE